MIKNLKAQSRQLETGDRLLLGKQPARKVSLWLCSFRGQGPYAELKRGLRRFRLHLGDLIFHVSAHHHP